jgi:type IV pilus assembly protein PilC
MIFHYKAKTKNGNPEEGNIEAPNVDLAISSLQRHGLVILDIKSQEDVAFIDRLMAWRGVKTKDIVFLSRQIATLFEAKVSALASFKLLASEAGTPHLRKVLTQVGDDLNSGVLISEALSKHPEVFSNFYVNMVKSGEESGRLSEVFNYLAAYLERSYALMSKAKNALIYPAFIIFSFIVVMILMLVFIIPKLSTIIKEMGQELPIYTKIVIGLSDFLVNYGILLLLVFCVLVYLVFRYLRTEAGKRSWSEFQLSVPYIKDLYQKLYLSRISDNLSTLLTSGVSMVRAIEVTADVIENSIYKKILKEAGDAVKSGTPMSTIMYKYPEIPTIMIQMLKVGEETGKLGFILDNLSRFYQREVYNAVDTLVGLIEPLMIVFLGLGVGFLLVSVMMPIYNMASGF